MVTEQGICLIGQRIKTISKADIAKIEVTPWNIRKTYNSFGISLLFWKPLLKITLNNAQEVYVRSVQAEHLKEDLESALN